MNKKEIMSASNYQYTNLANFFYKILSIILKFFSLAAKEISQLARFVKNSIY